MGFNKVCVNLLIQACPFSISLACVLSISISSCQLFGSPFLPPVASSVVSDSLSQIPIIFTPPTICINTKDSAACPPKVVEMERKVAKEWLPCQIMYPERLKAWKDQCHKKITHTAWGSLYSGAKHAFGYWHQTNTLGPKEKEESVNGFTDEWLVFM